MIEVTLINTKTEIAIKIKGSVNPLCKTKKRRFNSLNIKNVYGKKVFSLCNNT